MKKPIGTLLIVLGSPRSGKTTFIRKLGRRMDLRVLFLGTSYRSITWEMPKKDDLMYTNLLVCGKTAQQWSEAPIQTPLLVYHSCRWTARHSKSNFAQCSNLISLARKIIVVLVFPRYKELVKRNILFKRDIGNLPHAESEYMYHKQTLEACCKNNNWYLFTVSDVNSL
jgi:hypothetical protein